MINIATLSQIESTRWHDCVGTKGILFEKVATRLVHPDAKATYQQIEARTGVPWFVVAVIHEREASQNFTKSIAQGDSWMYPSIHVPKGRGPFKSFADAAYDALVYCAPKAAKWTDWSVGGTLTILEEYNGLGYASMGRPSPYIWAGTNQYVSGKYTADGHYSPTTVDTQLGCAGLLMAMMALDKSIVFSLVTPNASTPTVRISPSKPAVPVVPTVHAPPLAPSVSHPAPGSLGDGVAKVLGSLFGHLRL